MNILMREHNHDRDRSSTWLDSRHHALARRSVKCRGMIRNGRGRNSCVGGCASDDGVEQRDSMARIGRGMRSTRRRGLKPGARCDVPQYSSSIHVASNPSHTRLHEKSRPPKGIAKRSVRD